MPDSKLTCVAACLATTLLFVACEAAPPMESPQQPPPPAVPPEGLPPIAAPFSVALWPGEGIPEFDAARGAVPLRTAASLDASVHDTLQVTAGARLHYDSTRFITIAPAIITVLRADTITGRDFGQVKAVSREQYHAEWPTAEFGLTTASTLELLQHRAEGTCFVRLEGRVIESDPCPLFDVGAFRPNGDPRTEWWLFVTGGDHGGGWVVVSDSTVRLAGRRF